MSDPTAINLWNDPLQQRMRGVAIHGDTPFDVPYISEIADNLWQGGCMNDLVLPSHIKHIVSLYRWEQYTIQHEMLSQVEVEMYDSIDQGFAQVEALANWVNVCRKTGPVLIHCQAGLNRSSLVVAWALILDGMKPDDAITLIREKRSPACLCNPAFEEWLRD